MTKIDKGTRCVNFITDYLVIFLIWIIVIIFSGGKMVNPFYYYIIMFSYYFIFETTRGQTVGKMITKTKVVNKDGTKPKDLQIFARSFLRLIPIDIISYLFGTELGFHDIFSSTKLKKID